MRGRAGGYCVEVQQYCGCSCAELSRLALAINRRKDIKCLVVGLESRLGSDDGSWCRDACTAERHVYWPVRVGQGCDPGERLGVCALRAGLAEGRGGDTLCVLWVDWYGARKGVLMTGCFLLLAECTTRRSARKRVVLLGSVLHCSCSRTWLCLGGNRLNPDGL